MNNIGEKINADELTKNSLTFNLSELLGLLKRNLTIFYSWGASNFTVNDINNPKKLKFNVNGKIHKGRVYIFLNSSDLFDVYLTKKTGKITKIGKNLYFYELRDWIDESIEKQENYIF